MMAVSVIIEEQIEIPLDLRSLADFRRWAQSNAFPEHGRIDYIAGNIEIDMSPEDLFCHGILKTEIVGVLHRVVKENQLGYLFTDSTRVSCPGANLSAEPDVVFVSHEALRQRRVRLVKAASAEPAHYVELEGAPDLIVEIVSKGSVAKDTRRLPAAYFQAGVREFWLADARKEPALFEIRGRAEMGYEPIEADPDGYQRSDVFACGFRLEGHRDREGIWTFDLGRKV